MRIRPVAAELFRADRQTGRQDEANCRFRNFANAPKYDACPLELSRLRHRTGGVAPSPSRSEALKSGQTDVASPSDSHHSVPIVHRPVVADGHSFESAATDTSLPDSVSPCPLFNPLTPNDTHGGRTALLTSKRCILYIYSTNIGTEYF